MSAISRRSFVFLSTGGVVGNLVVPGLAEDSPSEVRFAQSGLVTGRPKPLRQASIPGFLSAEQISPHHSAHYGGALKGYLAAELRLEKSFRSDEAVDPAAYGAVKQSVNSKGNSVVLHELYFDGMTAKAPDPAAEVRAAIEARFGSLQRWSADFVASALAAAGWAMLVRHPVNGRLYNVVSDEHAQGVLWMAVPLVVLDVYEHAYYVDYTNRKGEYVGKFLEHVDWSEVAARFRAATKA